MAKETGDIVEAVKGIVEAVPVYQDAIQPGAKQIGTALETIGKAVNLALAPVAGLVWGWEQVREFVIRRVSEKLQKVPPERIQTPGIYEPLENDADLQGLREESLSLGHTIRFQ